MMQLPFAQMLHRRLRHEEIAEDVRAEGAFELFGGDVFDAVLRVLLGGVVHENVEAAELFHGLVDNATADLFVADIARQQDAFSAMLLDALPRLLRIAIFLEIVDRHVGAFLGEGDRHRTADAAVAAGDERDLAVEFTAAAMLRVFGLWARRHFVFATGLAWSAFGRASSSFSRAYVEVRCCSVRPAVVKSRKKALTDSFADALLCPAPEVLFPSRRAANRQVTQKSLTFLQKLS